MLCSYELNGISGDKNNRFFREFMKWFVNSTFAEQFLKYPTTNDEIQHITGCYDRLGVPGCVGSVDCAHVTWDLCPAGLLVADCKGKYTN
jgi:hypothetical protein